jgi:hypothetical protein
MKNATIVFRILLGFLYLVFGFDHFLHFIPYQPHHTGNAKAFKDGLKAAGYFYPMQKVIQICGGKSLLVNRYINESKGNQAASFKTSRAISITFSCTGKR